MDKFLQIHVKSLAEVLLHPWLLPVSNSEHQSVNSMLALSQSPPFPLPNINISPLAPHQTLTIHLVANKAFVELPKPGHTSLIVHY